QDTPFAGVPLDEELSFDAFMWTNIVTCLVMGPRALLAEYVEMFLIYIMSCFIPWMWHSIANDNPNGIMPEEGGGEQRAKVPADDEDTTIRGTPAELRDMSAKTQGDV
ncbi:MAG: hypothetical protein Q9180_005215, partial [Flavoplaca navasiana]